MARVCAGASSSSPSGTDESSCRRRRHPLRTDTDTPTHRDGLMPPSRSRAEAGVVAPKAGPTLETLPVDWNGDGELDADQDHAITRGAVPQAERFGTASLLAHWPPPTDHGSSIPTTCSSQSGQRRSVWGMANPQCAHRVCSAPIVTITRSERITPENCSHRSHSSPTDRRQPPRNGA